LLINRNLGMKSSKLLKLWKNESNTSWIFAQTNQLQTAWHLWRNPRLVWQVSLFQVDIQQHSRHQDWKIKCVVWYSKLDEVNTEHSHTSSNRQKVRSGWRHPSEIARSAISISTCWDFFRMHGFSFFCTGWNSVLGNFFCSGLNLLRYFAVWWGFTASYFGAILNAGLFYFSKLKNCFFS